MRPVKPPSGVTALMYAAYNAAKVRLLLAAGADPNAVTRSGHSALLLATATDGAAESARLLRNAGATIDQAAKRSYHAGLAALGRAIGRGDTLLMIAAFEGWTDVRRVLLRAGAEVDRLDGDGYSALHSAAESPDRGSVEMVELSLSAK